MGRGEGEGQSLLVWYLVHMTKMAATLIYGKSHSIFYLFRNRWADYHEIWYVALGTPVHHSSFK